MPQTAIARRPLALGAAWGAPAVMVAASAPAFAASVCAPVTTTLLWTGAGFVPISTTSATSTSGALTATITVQTFGLVTVSAANLSAHAPPNGSLTWTGLTLTQGSTAASGSTGNYNSRQVITFSFNRVVTDLSFTITDVDSQGGSTANHWKDTVAVSPTVTTSIPGGGTTVGAGTVASPWTLPGQNSNYANTASTGNVTGTYSNPSGITSFTLEYWNTSNNMIGTLAGTNQVIYLSPLTITYCA